MGSRGRDRLRPAIGDQQYSHCVLDRLPQPGQLLLDPLDPQVLSDRRGKVRVLALRPDHGGEVDAHLFLVQQAQGPDHIVGAADRSPRLKAGPSTDRFGGEPVERDALIRDQCLDDGRAQIVVGQTVEPDNRRPGQVWPSSRGLIRRRREVEVEEQLVERVMLGLLDQGRRQNVCGSPVGSRVRVRQPPGRPSFR